MTIENIVTIDHQKVVALLKERLEKEGKGIPEFARELGMPRSIALLNLQGSRRPNPRRLTQFIEYLDLQDAKVPRLGKAVVKPKGNHIFVSYSHRDNDYLDRLLVHLKPLQRDGLIDTWVDTRLLAGDKWKKEIDAALKKARVAILLISADFLASDFIIKNELPPLLQAAEERGTLIIPVILRPCRFTREKVLREFQAINPPDEPLSVLDENGRELIYDSIAQRIEDMFN